ncbi:MAG: PQQ-binding-like beta-propeller repeat protein, partial [Planctomycetaceae bacterium]
MLKTRSRVVVGVSLALGMLPVVLNASDWRTYLHDNTRGGATDEHLVWPLQQHWKTVAPGALNMAWSGPNGRIIEGKDLRHRVQFDSVFHVAVAGNRLFFGSSVDHTLNCVDVDTGRRLWRFFADGPIRLAPTVWQDIVLFGADDGFVYALRETNGELLWKRRGGPAEEWLLARGEMISRWPIRTGVLVERGVAYFGAGIFPHEDVYLYAVRPQDGSLVWQRDNISESDAGRNDLSPQGYLLATHEKLVVPSGRSLPGVFNRLNGEFLYKREHKWRREAGGVVGGTRALLADGQLYAAGPHHMLALDEESGDVGFGWFEGRQMTVSGGDAFVATGDAIVRIDRSTYAVASRERQKINQEIYNLNRKLRNAKDEADAIRKSIAELNDRLQELADVGIVWRKPSVCESALIVAGDQVIAGGQQQVVTYSIQDGQKLWSAQVDAEASGLAVAQQNLFVSTTAGSIYAFGPGEPAARAKTENVKQGSPFPRDGLTAVYRDAARSVLKQSGVARGFCLVLDSGYGRLAAELARQSDLRVYCVESDAKLVAESRRLLSRAGLYGHRIVVHHSENGGIPYSNYFANLIVSDRMVRTGRLPDDPDQLARHVKPLGGAVCLGTVPGTPQEISDTRGIQDWFQKLGFERSATVSADGSWACLTRGALPGAGDWSHQYGDSGNTASTDDTRVQGGLGVLWYGDPGPGKMVNRHEGAVGPLAVNGRLIVEGQDSVLAFDAYNGAFLWEHKNPQSQRTGVFQNYSPGNLVASQDRVFVMEGSVCTQIDAASGQVQRVHQMPPSRDGKTYSWGYLAYRAGRLFGTATMR